MRWLVLLLAGALALGIAGLAVPRLIGALLRLPGDEAVEVAVAGEHLRMVSYLRGVDSRQRSIAFMPERRSLAELGILYYDRATQAPADSPQQRELLGSSLDAFQESLTYSPVQPMAWLMIAEIELEQSALEAAARAFDWSILTSGYLQQQTRPRTLLGLRLWDRLQEETRARLMDSIVATLQAEPELVAQATVDAGISDDIDSRLRAFGERGSLRAAQLRAAIRRNRHALARTASEEPVDMRRLLAASTVILTASVPQFAQAMTVEQYLAITRDQVPDQPPESVFPYLTGVLDGLLMLNQFNGDEGEPLFCMPAGEEIEINLPEFKRTFDAMLDEFERELPDFADLARTRSVGLAALDLMTRLHPCDSQIPEPSSAG